MSAPEEQEAQEGQILLPGLGEQEKKDAFRALQVFRSRSLFTDCSFRVGGEVINAHRCVVAAASPVMLAMLQAPLREGRSAEVEVESGDPESFSLLLDYMYGSPVRLEDARLLTLLELAAAYQVNGLVAGVCHVLMEALDAENCCSILSVADRYDLHDLRARTLEYALDDFDAVRTEANLLDLPISQLEELIGSPLLANTEEDAIMDAVLRWVATDPDGGRIPHLPRLMTLVRGPLLRDPSIVKDVVRSRLEGLVSAEQVDEAARACTVKAWASNDVERRRTCRLQKAVTIEGHAGGAAGGVSALVWLPNGLLCSGSWDRTIRVWEIDVRPGGRASRCVQVLVGHEGAVLALTVVGEDLFVSGAADGTLISWSLETYQQVNTLHVSSGAILSLLYCAESRKLLCGCRDGSISVTDRDLAGVNKLWGHDSGVYAIERLRRDASGELVLSGANEGCIRMWRITPHEDACCGKYKQPQPVHALALVDESHVLAGSYEGTISLLEFPEPDALGQECKRIATYPLHSDAVSSLCFSGDDAAISGGWDGAIMSFNARHGDKAHKVEERTGHRILSIAFKKSRSKVLACGTNEGIILVYK